MESSQVFKKMVKYNWKWKYKYLIGYDKEW